jgi:hypothetical protein
MPLAAEQPAQRTNNTSRISRTTKINFRCWWCPDCYMPPGHSLAGTAVVLTPETSVAVHLLANINDGSLSDQDQLTVHSAQATVPAGRSKWHDQHMRCSLRGLECSICGITSIRLLAAVQGPYVAASLCSLSVSLCSQPIVPPQHTWQQPTSLHLH